MTSEAQKNAHVTGLQRAFRKGKADFDRGDYIPERFKRSDYNLAYQQGWAEAADLKQLARKRKSRK